MKQSIRNTFEFDVALSFADEDRVFVNQVAEQLLKTGLKVFYDAYQQIDLRGQDLVTHLDDVYCNKAKYCVIFASQHYANKLWTNHDRRSVQSQTYQMREQYILPARFDETEIPGVLPTTGYLSLKNMTPIDLAMCIIDKLLSQKT